MKIKENINLGKIAMLAKKSTFGFFVLFLALTLTFSAMGVTPAQAGTTTITESFQNATAPGWTLLGSGYDSDSGNHVAELTKTFESDGWLRLTDSTDQAGAAVNDTVIPSSSSFDIQFDYVVYNGTGEGGADGFAFYMIDGATTTPTLGAGGGNLGYVGTTGAYFGVGFSEFGDDQVRIWGPFSATPLVTVSTDPTNLIPTDGRSAKHVRITYADNFISVWVVNTADTDTPVISNYDLSAYTPPSTFKMGLSAGTGGYWNIHEIRNFTATTTPVVGLSPSSKDFGSQEVATTSVETEFTITNNGDGVLNLGLLSITGSDKDDFILDSAACDNKTLASGASCSYYVAFAPSAAGLRSASVNIPSDASTSPDSVALNGTGECVNSVIVTSAADDGVGSLREAIVKACAGGTITFDGDTIITLASMLRIEKSLTIDGSGHKITVSGDANNSGGANPGDVGVFTVNITVTANLNNLTITKGYAANGACINNNGTVNVIKSTISNCAASNTGGGIYNNGGTVNLTNSTLYGNSAFRYGGGIHNSGGTLNITNSTIAGNSNDPAGTVIDGAGINNNLGSTLNLNNTIIADSTGGSDCHNRATVNGTNNLVENNAASSYSCGVLNTNYITGDPLLGSLADNGGSTQTLALLSGSPAIDAGASCPATDQRGYIRDAACDIGAYEYHYAGTYYVKPSASGAMNCRSWADACELQTALITAASGDKIWVAKGIYKPGTLQTDTFQLSEGVKVYGGFPDTGNPIFTDRDPANHLTILSGDINGDDSQTPIITDINTVSGNTNNSYHVVTGATDATLDGFTITAGYAWGAGGASHCEQACGGGLYNSDVSGLTLTTVAFRGNSASYHGGGMFDSDSSFTMTDVTFSSNKAAIVGGGLGITYFSGDSSASALTNVTFSGNKATGGSDGDGGGLYNNGRELILTNVTFSGNSATGNGGGMYTASYNSTLTNATFSGNSATGNGGGVYYYSTGSPTIQNVILWGNTASSGGAQISTGNNSTPVVSNSVIENGYNSDPAIITNNPRLGDLGDYGGPTQTIPLLPGSSAIDAGTTTYCTTGSDQRGVSYVGTCDIGAFESQGFTFSNQTGTPQNAATNAAFTNPLGLTVMANNAVEPVENGKVTFSAPSSGASTNPVTATATINSSGAVSQSVTANGTVGGPYNVVASAAGAASVNFVLTNVDPDTTPPVVTVPANMTVEATSSAGAVISFSATATEETDPPNPAVTCAPPSESTFPLGVNTVNCSASDTAGNIGTNSFTITVRDTTAPVVTVPANMIVEATGPGGRVVSFSTSATDTVAPANPVVTCVQPSSSTFPLGVNTVNCSATDTAGNTGTNSFTITVRDTTPPVVTVPANMIVEATSAAGRVVTFSASATDTVAPPNPAVTCVAPSGSTFPLGVNTVNCSATDTAGNTSTNSFTITVRDTTAPVLNLPANMTVSAPSAAGAVVTFTATATDTVAPLIPVVTCVPPSGSTFPLGVNTINCSATDTAGNTANGSFTIHVIPATSLPQLLKMPTFDKMIVPIPWTVKLPTIPFASVRDCTVSLSPNCSVKFVGKSTNPLRYAEQSFIRRGNAGDKFYIGLSSRAENVPTTGLYKVEVFFYDLRNRVVGSQALNFSIGTHDWETLGTTYTVPAAYYRVAFRFTFQNTAGTAWFDNAFLMIVP